MDEEKTHQNKLDDAWIELDGAAATILKLSINSKIDVSILRDCLQDIKNATNELEEVLKDLDSTQN